jgi:hypothetical protein
LLRLLNRTGEHFAGHRGAAGSLSHLSVATVQNPLRLIPFDALKFGTIFPLRLHRFHTIDEARRLLLDLAGGLAVLSLIFRSCFVDLIGFGYSGFVSSLVGGVLGLLGVVGGLDGLHLLCVRSGAAGVDGGGFVGSGGVGSVCFLRIHGIGGVGLRNSSGIISSSIGNELGGSSGLGGVGEHITGTARNLRHSASACANTASNCLSG